MNNLEFFVFHHPTKELGLNITYNSEWYYHAVIYMNNQYEIIPVNRHLPSGSTLSEFNISQSDVEHGILNSGVIGMIPVEDVV